MTDQELQEVTDRAEVEGQALAEVVIPKLRGEIWTSCATWVAIAAFILFCFYRSDFAALRADFSANVAALQKDVSENLTAIREDLKTIKQQPIQFQQEVNQQVNVPKSKTKDELKFELIETKLIPLFADRAKND